MAVALSCRPLGSILQGNTSNSNHDRTLLGMGVLVGAQLRDPV